MSDGLLLIIFFALGFVVTLLLLDYLQKDK